MSEIINEFIDLLPEHLQSFPAFSDNGVSRNEMEWKNLAILMAKEIERLLADNDRLRSEVERCKTVINDLCRLKAMKDQLGKTSEYKHFQPIAWKEALKLLAQLQESDDES